MRGVCKTGPEEAATPETSAATPRVTEDYTAAESSRPALGDPPRLRVTAAAEAMTANGVGSQEVAHD